MIVRFFSWDFGLRDWFGLIVRGVGLLLMSGLSGILVEDLLLLPFRAYKGCERTKKGTYALSGHCFRFRSKLPPSGW